MVNYAAVKVLVVDDFDSFRMTVSRMLSDFGCRTVDTAVNGNEALRLCEENDYDLILCDYNLGKGRNGLQLLEEMRHKNLLRRSNLFLLVSAESSRNIVLAASDYEPDGYLTKPITAKTLRQRLDRVLHQRQSMKSVYRAIEDNYLDRAIVLCLTKLDENSRYAVLCQKLLGALYIKTQQYDLAEQLYRQVLEMRELDWAQVGMAQVEAARGNDDRAEDWLQQIIQLQPLCMPAYDELAELYRRQGKEAERQKVLEQAVAVSPVALLRQEKLAQVAQSNNDSIVAAQTYKKVVKLSENSVHDKVENHMAFTRAAVAAFAEDETVGRDVLREALAVVDQVESRFGKDDTRKLQLQLIESQLQLKQGNTKRANELFMAANQAIEALGLMDIDTELDRVMTLQALGQNAKANDRLVELVEAFKDDESALEKIDRLLDDPVSEAACKQVASINKEGIRLYEQQAYMRAIECFQRARRLFPRHLGVQLNLVQALVGQMRTGDENPQWMDIAIQCLKGVESSINGTHPQFQRYRQLQDMLRQADMEIRANQSKRKGK
ncbi:tetratricopeptide repeat-containing response regulator [Simiduia agarivorans]|uniref:Response regulator receiver domain-containing protein n=1 Tax=Simiduia agarivorans (strain DSM 21679 / JCM 13881 / BCRC 17597 / SA1) TaxID=1117647 RepID=K4KGA4_SIMAS|nr:tetratricopeptide repeat-containing response regulator [Simiduia agarivorans]AFU98006.1 response regulator receiver domain-containing protein [Simiduia agarivorans SA1 = DSM 21679]